MCDMSEYRSINARFLIISNIAMLILDVKLPKYHLIWQLLELNMPHYETSASSTALPILLPRLQL